MVSARAGPPSPASTQVAGGQTALPSLLHDSATFSVGTVILLIVCKGLAHRASLSSFRGGPCLPSGRRPCRRGRPRHPGRPRRHMTWHTPQLRDPTIGYLFYFEKPDRRIW